MRPTLKNILEKLIMMGSHFFPFIEISSVYSSKVFLNTGSTTLTYIHINYLSKLNELYSSNSMLFFALMVGIFTVCSRGTVPTSKYVRYNIIQAILLNIACACIDAIYPLVPLIIRESSIGILFANTLFIGIVIVILYSWILIIFGRYATIPVISEAARMQVQRGYRD